MLQILIVLFIASADQITKYLAVAYLKPLRTVPILEGIFSQTYVENRGAAFGILQNQRWFLVVLPLVIIAVIIFYLASHRHDSLLRKISLAVILGGAAGNLIDRMFHGFVIDMLQATFVNFPVFNTADSAVVCGTILLAFQLLFLEKSQS
jgi:signal peptidase II